MFSLGGITRNISVGIDIGTYQVKVLIAEKQKDRKNPVIIGTGYSESKGLRHGYIINSIEATRSIRSAIEQAEKSSGVKIRNAYVSAGGIGLSSITASGDILISRGDSEITNLDLQKVIDSAQEEIPETYISNRKIIDDYILQYKIDGKQALGNPIGLKGAKLEAKVLFVTILKHHYSDLVQSIQDSGIKVLDILPTPIAASFVTLTKTQKIAGCVLANIGSETVSIVVFENGAPISLEVFPIGSTDITNDIALGLRIPLEEAESIKRGAITASQYPKKKLDEIIEARLSDIFELIEAHLKKIGRNGLLPAGIILTGGGSGLTSIEDLARVYLRLPSRLAQYNYQKNDTNGNAKAVSGIKDSTWSVSYGLATMGLHSEYGDGNNENSIMKGPANAGKNLWDWLSQFAP